MNSFFSNVFHLVMKADISSYPSMENKKKSILFHLFFIFYALVITGFIVSNILLADYLFMTANLMALLIGLFLYYYLYLVKKKLNLVASIFILTTTTLVTFFIQTGGIKNTALIYALLLPLPAILLLGKQKGLLILGAFLLINAAGFFLFQNQPWFPQYNINMLGRTAIVFLLVSLIAYSNEYVFVLLYKRLEKLSESLKISQQGYKNLAINKERFVSMISNNLSDHIGSFAAIANLLKEDYYKFTDQQRIELIHNMANVSQQNFKLLQDLMKWSTVQNELVPFSPQPIKIEKIYREVTELFVPLIEEKKLSFFLKIKSNSEVFADEGMVSAILRNLVSNAIKFTNPGGEIRISAEEKNDQMYITVSDNGIGMSLETLMRINAHIPFSAEGAIPEASAGIGLILANEFVKKNRGRLHIDSEIGKGTHVSFTLPLSE